MARNIKVLSLEKEFTRPANTTAYASSDVVSDSAVDTDENYLKLVADPFLKDDVVFGQSARITVAKLTKSTTGTTNASFRLYLYTSGVSSLAADNSAFQMLYGNKHIRVGYVDFTMAAEGTGAGSCAEAIATDVNIDLRTYLTGSSSALFGVLVAKGAYTPGSAETFFVQLKILITD